jgi:hypothetical protein
MDTNTIKQYNQRVTTLQKNVSQIMAEKKIRTQELENLCKELSEEMGREVTPENIESVYKEVATQIEDTIKSGTEILERVEAELGVQQQVQGVQTMQRPVQGVQPVQQQNMNYGTYNNGLTVQTPVQPQVQQQPVQQQAQPQQPAFNPGFGIPQTDGIAPSNNLGAGLINFDKINSLSI